VLVATHAVRNLVRDGKTNQLRNQLITGAGEGMQTLEMGLSNLVAAGEVDYDEAVRVSGFPRDIARPQPFALPEATFGSQQSAAVGA
jgi:twitching motility protein PilT